MFHVKLGRLGACPYRPGTFALREKRRIQLWIPSAHEGRRRVSHLLHQDDPLPTMTMLPRSRPGPPWWPRFCHRTAPVRTPWFSLIRPALGASTSGLPVDSYVVGAAQTRGPGLWVLRSDLKNRCGDCPTPAGAADSTPVSITTIMSGPPWRV